MLFLYKTCILLYILIPKIITWCQTVVWRETCQNLVLSHTYIKNRLHRDRVDSYVLMIGSKNRFLIWIGSQP